jgi:hypothetical protein
MPYAQGAYSNFYRTRRRYRGLARQAAGLLTPLGRLVVAGYHPNRRTLEILRDAGFAIGAHRRLALQDLPRVDPQVVGMTRKEP